MKKLLKDMHEDLYFKDQLHELHKIPAFPQYIREKMSMRNTLEVVAFVATEEQLKVLTADPTKHSEKTRMDLYATIELAVFDKCCEFEGKDPKLERKTQKKKSGNTPKATYLAIGKRIRSYKQHIAESLGLDKKQNVTVELRERSDIPDPGTPKGHKSISHFFETKK